MDLRHVELHHLRRGPSALKDILAPDRIEKLPLAFGFHGTTSFSALDIMGGGLSEKAAMECAMGKGGRPSEGFNIFLTSARGFNLSDDWAEEVSLNEVRSSIKKAVRGAVEAAFDSVEDWVDIRPERGIGVIAVEFTPKLIDCLKECDGICGKTPYGPFARSLPFDRFVSNGYRIKGIVVSDKRLNNVYERYEPARFKQILSGGKKALTAYEKELDFAFDIPKIADVFLGKLGDMLADKGA